MRTVQEYDQFVTDTQVGHVADYNMPLEYIIQTLSNVRGHVVNMPLHYLEKEQLIAGGVNFSVNVVTGISYSFMASDFVRRYLYVRVSICDGGMKYRILKIESQKSYRNHGCR